MSWELVPFVCGACWYYARRASTRGLIWGSLAIGVATAAAAGELSAPWPGPALALLADTAGAAAGWLFSHFVLRQVAR
jgi:anti-sigma factor RsiW